MQFYLYLKEQIINDYFLVKLSYSKTINLNYLFFARYANINLQTVRMKFNCIRFKYICNVN